MGNNVVGIFTRDAHVTDSEETVESLRSCNVVICTSYEILFSVRDYYSNVEPNHKLRQYINEILSKSLLLNLDHPQCPDSVYDLYLKKVKPAMLARLNS